MHTATWIQAVPWWPARTANAVRLARETGGVIIWDETQSGLGTWLRLLRAAAEFGPALVLEDDIELADHWRERVERGIRAHPTSVIRFFTADRFAELEGWLPGKAFGYQQCVYLPDPAAILSWVGNRRLKRWIQGHDMVVADWLTSTRLPFWNHVPSLVQHLPYESLASSGRSRHRQSTTFGAADADH